AVLVPVDMRVVEGLDGTELGGVVLGVVLGVNVPLNVVAVDLLDGDTDRVPGQSHHGPVGGPVRDAERAADTDDPLPGEVGGFVDIDAAILGTQDILQGVLVVGGHVVTHG